MGSYMIMPLLRYIRDTVRSIYRASFCQVFLVTDLLYAQLRRQVAELYGAKVDSKDAVGFILQ